MIPKYSDDARILENPFNISNVRLGIPFVNMRMDTLDIPKYDLNLQQNALVGYIQNILCYNKKGKGSPSFEKYIVRFINYFFNLLDMSGKKTEMWYRILSLLQWTIQREFLSFIKCKMGITELTNALLQMITEHHFQSPLK